MSAIYRRDAYAANKTQTGELKLEENLSATAYLALIRFLRREKLAEKPDLLERVKNVITDTMPYRAAFKQKRFVEQLTCPEEKFESMIFEKTPITNGETRRFIGWQGISWECVFRMLIEVDCSFEDMMTPSYKDFPKMQDLPEDVQEMYELVDSLPERARDGYIREAAQSLISTMWNHNFWNEQTRVIMRRPAARVRYMFARRCSIKRKDILVLDERLQENEEVFNISDAQRELIHELANILAVRETLTTSNESQLPQIAKAFGTSLHWLMGMPSTLRLYAENATTEDIIDAYYFMSPANKTTFRNAVKKFKEKIARMEADED